MALKMEMGNLNGPMGLTMKENFRMDQFMGMGNILGQMGEYTMGVGWRERCMAKGDLYGRMVRFMRANM